LRLPEEELKMVARNLFQAKGGVTGVLTRKEEQELLKEISDNILETSADLLR